MTEPKSSHRHTKAGCLKILRNLSEYLDDELSRDVCKEIRRHLGACPRCEVFLDSLRQTVFLCRHAEGKRLSRATKSQLRRRILETLGRA